MLTCTNVHSDAAHDGHDMTMVLCIKHIDTTPSTFKYFTSRPSVTSFAGSMQEIPGNRVGFCATPKAPHDLLLTHPLFDMEGELCAALDEAHRIFDGGK